MYIYDSFGNNCSMVEPRFHIFFLIRGLITLSETDRYEWCYSFNVCCFRVLNVLFFFAGGDGVCLFLVLYRQSQRGL